MPAVETLYPKPIQDFLLYINALATDVTKDEETKIQESLEEVKGMINVDEKNKEIFDQLNKIVEEDDVLKKIIPKITELLKSDAGSSAVQALLAKRVDATYVGPGPAVNGYVASQGKDLRIISGAASGGVVFVVRNDSGIKSHKDFANKVFASPQLANTQDTSLRKYLQDNGYKTKDNGGNVTVVSTDNPIILTLFLKKQIDGAWVPEPWVQD
ncbi:MAG: ABC transporter substrate-binding protein [Candidatus Nitrosopolaris sp.]